MSGLPAPYYQDKSVTLYQDDALAVLRELPGESVQTCVTSPPYWGLRDYGTATWEGGADGCDHRNGSLASPKSTLGLGKGQASHESAMAYAETGLPFRGDCGKCGARRIDAQLGLEPTPEAYVAQMVAVFREVWRVLRDDGTLWLNLGSSYFGGGGFCPTAPSTATSKSGKYGTAGALIAGHSSGGRPASLSRQPERDPAYGTDGTALQDSRVSDSSYSGLCDECLADFLSHHDRIAGNGRPIGQSSPPPSRRDRGSEPSDSVEASLGASPLDAQGSTSLESWLQHRGACSRCATRVASLSGWRSSSPDAPESAGMSWLNYTTKLKPKDMVPIPWMVAMALQADGWYLRSDIIWAKPNPMPESVTDRPTKSHEYLFLLSKRERYVYDAEAIKEPLAPSTLAWANGKNGWGPSNLGHATPSGIHGPSLRGQGRCGENANGRNRRSVWEIATQPYPEAHFATFPVDLVKPCVLAGAPDAGMVLDPFVGSGTTCYVAKELGRRAIGIDLNPAYLELAVRRLRQEVLLWDSSDAGTPR